MSYEEIKQLRQLLTERDSQIKSLEDKLELATKTIKDLIVRITNQRKELRSLNRSINEKNLKLDALFMVWCPWGCENGMSRYVGEHPTQDIVLSAIVNTHRMLRWFVNHNQRIQQDSSWISGVKTFKSVTHELKISLVAKLANALREQDELKLELTKIIQKLRSDNAFLDVADSLDSLLKPKASRRP